MKRLLLIALVIAGCKGKDKPPPAPVPPPVAPAPATPADASVQPHVVKIDMPPPAEIRSLVRANNNFGLELWAQAGTGNLAMSPLSISTALAMAWAGAKGDTAAQMRHVMHLEGDADLIVSQWARISYALQDQSRPLELELANRLYGDSSFQFDTIYYTITRKAFSAPLEIVDFKHDAEGVRAKINTWVAEHTGDKVKDFVPKGAVDSGTRMVIVNAISFLADWAQPFTKEQTVEETFKVGADKTVRVPMMHRQGTYRLAHAEGAQLLELPYAGETASMYILLPDQPFGILAMERKLYKTLVTLQGKLADANVAVSLPRFTIDPSEPLRLSKPLSTLGMPAVFNPVNADFSGMAKPDDKNRLFIAELLHEAYVKVDEKGTEAAAATAAVMPTGAAPSAATPFKADHPFVFLIIDRGSGLILFIGRVVEPKQEQSAATTETKP